MGPDIDSLRKQLTSRTRAVLVQHLFGLVCRDFEKIIDLSSSTGLRLIEDCAHAMGAVYKGRKVGNWGAIGFYSMEHTKVISSQQGGLAVTNDAELAESLRIYQQACDRPEAARVRKLLSNTLLSYHLYRDPRRWLLRDYYRFRYGHDLEMSTTDEEMRGERPRGYLRQMPPPAAMLALRQLRRIDQINDARRAMARHWQSVCDAKRLIHATVIPESTPVFLRFPVLLPETKKNDVQWCVREFGMPPGLWFSGEWHPIAHIEPHCPNAHYATEHCINLPTML